MKDKKLDKNESSEDRAKRLKKEKLKEKYRNAELTYSGRLVIDDKYKKPGKVLRIDNDDFATRKYLESLGYTIVQKDIGEDAKVGSGSLREPGDMGSAVHIEQGIVFSQPGILYEIDEDEYNARKEVEAEQNDAQLQNQIESNQYDGQDKSYNR